MKVCGNVRFHEMSGCLVLVLTLPLPSGCYFGFLHSKEVYRPLFTTGAIIPNPKFGPQSFPQAKDPTEVIR